jgi:hypothetical protein
MIAAAMIIRGITFDSAEFLRASTFEHLPQLLLRADPAPLRVISKKDD